VFPIHSGLQDTLFDVSLSVKFHIQQALLKQALTGPAGRLRANGRGGGVDVSCGRDVNPRPEDESEQA
jgi:hypothetical protein